MKFHDTAVLKRLRTLADKHNRRHIRRNFHGIRPARAVCSPASRQGCPGHRHIVEGLTGGTLPPAATVATREILEAFWSDDPQTALMHGPTLMANALACAAANASLDLFEREPRLTQVGDIGAALERGLAPCRGLPRVTDVRVKGAIGVVELDHIGDLNAIRTRFVDLGVFVRPIGNVIYLTPAFTISAEELKRLTDAVVKIAHETKY